MMIGTHAETYLFYARFPEQDVWVGTNTKNLKFASIVVRDNESCHRGGERIATTCVVGLHRTEAAALKQVDKLLWQTTYTHQPRFNAPQGTLPKPFKIKPLRGYVVAVIESPTNLSPVLHEVESYYSSRDREDAKAEARA